MRTPRTRVVLTVLVVLAAVLPAGAARAGLRRTLTIVGSRNSVAILTVTRDTLYDLEDSSAVYAGGRWGGFAIGTDWPRLWTSFTDPRVPYFHGGVTEPADGDFGPGVLRPGRYRVYLFADGQDVKITLPWSGPNVTLEPDAPLDARIGADQVTVTPGTTVASVPQDGRAGTVTSFVMGLRYGPSGAFHARACFARKPTSWKTCDHRLGGASNTVPGGTEGGFRMGNGYPSEIVTHGRHWYGEVVGTATGVFTLMTIRYKR